MQSLAEMFSSFQNIKLKLNIMFYRFGISFWHCWFEIKFYWHHCFVLDFVSLSKCKLIALAESHLLKRIKDFN